MVQLQYNIFIPKSLRSVLWENSNQMKQFDHCGSIWSVMTSCLNSNNEGSRSSEKMLRRNNFATPPLLQYLTQCPPQTTSLCGFQEISANDCHFLKLLTFMGIGHSIFLSSFMFESLRFGDGITVEIIEVKANPSNISTRMNWVFAQTIEMKSCNFTWITKGNWSSCYSTNAVCSCLYRSQVCVLCS